MSHDLMRGIKGGTPFLLMEQTPSVTNWLSYNALKRPGVMRLWSYQAVAHGADSVMFSRCAVPLEPARNCMEPLSIM